jgi:sugar lactone lactonase YvrE
VQFTATVASPEVHQLAEGPVWDAARERLVWVDIEAGTVLSGVLTDDGVAVTDRRTVDRYVGAVALAPDGDLLVAGRDSLFTLSGTPVARVVPPGVDSRLNDGACDPAGRFLIGTLALDDRRDQESLYRLEPSGELTVLDRDLGLSNGLAWSPDGTLLYSIDTLARTVWVRDYATLGPRRVCVRLEDDLPDGMCVDTDGNLWVAVFGAGEVRCFSPEGQQLSLVRVAAPHTTCVAFVGPALDTLLITTGRVGLSASSLSEHPLSGRLFTAQVGAHGLPTPVWSPVG